MNRLGLIIALAVCVPFWIAVGCVAARAETPTHAQLTRANRQINAAHRPNAPEPSDKADGMWDCENYAFAKRDALLATGMSYADLRVLALQNERGQWHAVLAVQTLEGEWILDNRYPNPQRRENLARFPGYHFETTFLMSDP
jgi:predicted transglutaminase-like cysteine proteinase